MIRRLLILAWATLLGLASVEAASDESGTGDSSADRQLSELQTADYYELVARAQELGLPITGSASDLRARIAQAEGIVLPAATTAQGQTLSIDSAQQAGLVAVDVPGDGKMLRLSGGLQVTLVDNDKKVTHIISADELWYDQANQEMTARGHVVYTMVRATSKEVFRGDSLTFRLSDSQGVFYGGASDRARTVGTQTLTFRYQGDAIRRSSSDLVVLETGTITSSLGTDPNYRIMAKRIWVLAPGEWGLQDAVLYVGRIPMLYFPFFFQPGDEFFFNPVLSFPDAEDRRGTSLQTTTYILGKKKKEASQFSFLQVEDEDNQDSNRVLKGLFLVKGTPPPSTYPADWILKYDADFYAHLGFLTAIDATLPGLGGLKTFTGAGGIGITRTVNADGTTFQEDPFQAELDPWAQSQWNGSWFGPWRLPFRWGGHFALDSGWGTLSIEYYSDPLLYNDLFGDRSENFSVFSLLGLGPATTTEVATTKSSLQWAGTLTLPPVSANAGLLFSLGTNSSITNVYDPEYNFYEPSQLTLPQITVTLGGNLWSSGGTAKAQATPSGNNAGSTTQNPAPSSGAAHSAADLIPPDGSSSSTSAGAAPAGPDTPQDGDLLGPSRLDNLPNGSDLAIWTSSIDWTLKPTMSTDTRFDNSTATGPSGSIWSVLYSRWSGAYDASLIFTTGRSDGTFTTTDTFTLHQQDQNTWYQSSSAAGVALYSTWALQDAAQTYSSLVQNLVSTWKPFATGGAWRESNVQYSLTTDLWLDNSTENTLFDGTTNTVTTHQLASQAIWYLIDGVPSLKLLFGETSTLPPLDPVETWTSTLTYTLPWAKTWTTTTATQNQYGIVWSPWETYGEWTPIKDFSLKEDYQYDLQDGHPEISTTTTTAWGFTVQYEQEYTTPYVYDTVNKVWAVSGPDAFIPQQLLIAYSLNLPTIEWWSFRNQFTSNVSFNWPINLQQYSSMPMSLSYTITYKLFRFMDFTISEGVVNNTAYRYFPFLTQTFGSGVVQTVNPLQDLWDSVSFWDMNALQRTGFKMTTLSLGLVHYLDDWVVKLTYSGSPQLNTAGTQYQWVSTFALLVQWNPLPELSTQVQVDQNGTLTIPKSNSTTTTAGTTTTSN